MSSSKINTSTKELERQISNLRLAEQNRKPKAIKKVALDETHKNQDARTRRLVLKDDQRYSDCPEKTIMVVGQTGGGKTTVVDALFNYLKDVDWEDSLRWKLTDLSYEEKNRVGDQTVSQTEWITVYAVPQLSDKVPFRLNLIDTPGFGDTRGLEHDQELVKNLSSFFNHCEGHHGIMVLDAVCFVVKAPDVRLTPAQKYVFQAVLSIFGKDVAENIFVFATFADTGKPKVYKALEKEKIVIKERLRFNNAVLFANCENVPGRYEDDDEEEEEDDPDMQKAIWEMGRKSFEKFFEKLVTLEPKSTQMTREVLAQRLQIQLYLDDMKKQIKNAVKKMQCLEKENSELSKHLEEMRENEDFTVTSDTIHAKEIPNSRGTNALYCKTCKTTCHYPCVKFEIFKYFCQAFNTNGQCTVCLRRRPDSTCFVSNHDFRATHIKDIVETKTVTFAEIKARYTQAKGRRDLAVDILDTNTLQYKTIKKDVEKLIDQAYECYTKLNEISLKENPLFKSDLIDHLIQQEEKEKSPGYMKRMQILCKVKQDAMTVQNVKGKQHYLMSVQDREDMKQFVELSKVYNPPSGATTSSN